MFSNASSYYNQAYFQAFMPITGMSPLGITRDCVIKSIDYIRVTFLCAHASYPGLNGFLLFRGKMQRRDASCSIRPGSKGYGQQRISIR